VAFRDNRSKDAVAFFQKTMEDASLTREQRKTLIREFVAKNREVAQAHRADQRAENRDERAKIRAPGRQSLMPSGSQTAQHPNATTEVKNLCFLF
jgi:hypothetical protein